jgi:hypothetical protein
MNSLEDLGFDASRFYLGGLCKLGHKWRDTEQSLRSIGGRRCCQCRWKSSQSALVESQQKQAQQLKAVQENASNLCLDEKSYVGVLCKRSHDYQGTGGSLRRRINKACYECEREKYIENSANDDYIARRSEYGRRHRQANKEAHRAKSNAWYAANRDRKQAKAKDWLAANRDRVRAYHRRYRQENIDHINQYLDGYYKTDVGRFVRKKAKNRRKAKKLENHSANYSKQQLNDRLQAFSGLCCYCLKSQGKTIDHFIAVSQGGSEAIGNLLPCCQSCNSSKHNADPLEWYSRQSFFSRQQWLKILKLLGKNEKTYAQIPLL